MNNPQNPPLEKELLLRILDLARWAPSGDNTQPWRFEILSNSHVVVHGSDTRQTVVYDRQGFASQTATGILLETMAIAASGFGLQTEITCRTNDPDEEHPLYDVHFKKDLTIEVDPLFPFIESRSVNRSVLETTPLTVGEKDQLLQNMGTTVSRSAYQILWLESLFEKLSMARITQSSGKLRLIIPEAYPVHKAVIEWNSQYSNDRIPDQALGLSLSILPLMCWIMNSWERVQFFNRFLGGTLIPRLELDLLPAIGCSAHFALLAPSPPRRLTDYIDAGRALCRFWLGTTSLGLQFQPEMTPLIFRSYALRGTPFSTLSGSLKHAEKIGKALDHLVGKDAADRAVFLGRVGRGSPPKARSLRLPLSDLLINS